MADRARINTTVPRLVGTEKLNWTSVLVDFALVCDISGPIGHHRLGDVVVVQGLRPLAETRILRREFSTPRWVFYQVA